MNIQKHALRKLQDILGISDSDETIAMYCASTRIQRLQEIVDHRTFDDDIVRELAEFILTMPYNKQDDITYSYLTPEEYAHFQALANKILGETERLDRD